MAKLNYYYYPKKKAKESEVQEFLSPYLLLFCLEVFEKITKNGGLKMHEKIHVFAQE
jgi:hypothetical protein